MTLGRTTLSKTAQTVPGQLIWQSSQYCDQCRRAKCRSAECHNALSSFTILIEKHQEFENLLNVPWF